MSSMRKRSSRAKSGARAARPGHLIALEPRMMFDGAAIVTAVDTFHQDAFARDAFLNDILTGGIPGQETGDASAFTPVSPLGNNDELTDWALRQPLAPFAPTQIDSFDRGQLDQMSGGGVSVSIGDAPSPETTIIFIDTAVTGYDQFVAEWQGRGQIVLIDSSFDGVAQIQSALQGRTGIEVIHIVSHGDEGAFFLGASRIDQSAVNGALAGAFAEIGSHLSADGDILIYGCDVGAGQAGQGLLDAIAAHSGADVAASIDDTGSILRGGNWTLENKLGVIEGATLAAHDWQGLLVPALISVSSTTSDLRVYNSAGVLVSSTVGTDTGFTGGVSVGVTAGGYAIWSNAGTIGGQAIDLRAVVVSSTTSGTTPDTIKFNQLTTTSNDPGFLIQSSGSTGTASIQVRWETVLAGTNTPIAGDVNYTIADIDGTGTNPAAPTRESVVVSTDTLSSFQSAGTSDIRFITTTAGVVTAYGTQNELASPPLPISAARFNWLNTSSWVITYNINRAGSTQAGFNHDGNNEFNFGTGGVTTSIPRIDLDLNDSTTTGAGYLATFTENGASVGIVDTDVNLSNPVGTIQNVTVTLTNAQTGDQFAINGSTAASGTLASGIAYTLTATGVTFTGAFTQAQYEAALKTVTFRNTTERPATVDRNITISFSNGTFSSNNAVSTIKVIEVNDLPTAANDGPLTTAEDTPILNINVLSNDVDIDDALTVTTATALNGTVTINANGTLNYTPNTNFNGTDTISYTVSDGRGGTSSAIVPITITAVNDAPTAVGSLPSRANLDAAAGINVATATAFADVDNAALTYSATGLPAGLSINATTGVISGTINRSASQTGGGIYNVVVTASDGSLSATQAFTWTVTNPAPTANNDTTLVVNEDNSGTTVNVLANDIDPDGDPLTITSATATSGAVVINADGTFTYTPGLNFNGTDTIVYTISDGQGGTATARVPVTINAVNDAPTRVGTLPPRTNIDATAGISVATAAAFTDVDNATLTYSAVGLPTGLSINATTGVISGTIDRSASQNAPGGVYTTIVTASDGSLSTTQTFSWTVTNPGPSAANNAATTNEDTPIPAINVLGNDSDPDGDPLSVTTASAPNGTVTINADGTLRYAPNANFNGTDTITYTISDGQGGTATATVTVTVIAVNDAPTAVGTLPPRTNVDAATGIIVPTAAGFTDVDNATLTYSASGLPAGLSINATTGVISGTIDRSASQGGTGGVYSVVVTARDAAGLTGTQTFSWTVTNPPPAAVNDTAALNEDATILIPVLGNDSDPDGDPITLISAVAALGQATVFGNQVRYTPPANFSGTTTISYTISDGQGGTSTATITVTVNPVNDAPTSTAIPPRVSVDGAAQSIPLAGFFTDADGDTLSYSAVGLPLGLSINATTGVISGTIDRSASQVNGGAYTVLVTASDGQGGVVEVKFPFTVTNPAPTANDDTATTVEDTPVIINVLANDSDPDGDPLAVYSPSALHGTVVVNGDGGLTYTPNPGYFGPDTITYKISDGQGGADDAVVLVTVNESNDTPVAGTIEDQSNLDGQFLALPVAGAFKDPDGDTLTYTATGLPLGLTIDLNTGIISGTIDANASQINGGVYTITVTADDGRGSTVDSIFSWTVSNPLPTAENDAVTTDEDTPIDIDVLANDTDPDGDPLTVVSADAGNGTVTINADGTITYTPNPNFNGEDTIIYKMTDGDGGYSTATVTVSVKPINDAPTTVGIPPQNGDDGAPVSFSVASAFADVDGDALRFIASGLPNSLVIDPDTGVISGTLDPGTSAGGPYLVTITAVDPFGETVTTTFLYSVQNIPPVAVNDEATTDEEIPVVIKVLSNDRDPEGDELTITSATATNGGVVINGDGTVTFTPDPDFNGIAVVTYTISDGNGGFATATATITVGAVNDAPTSLSLPDLANLDNQSVSVNVGDFFSDLDGDALNFSADNLPPGLTIDPATGIISGTIDKSASVGGPFVVTIIAKDPSGLITSQQFSWAISNPAPTAVNDTATTDEDVPVDILVLGNDTDPDADTLIVTTATALNGTVTIGAGGVLTYTPKANFFGTDTITYVISDGNGGTSTAAVAITVNSVNDNPVAVTDTRTTEEDTPITVGVLVNDSDVDLDTLTVTDATVPASEGTVVVNADGTVTFTPAENFTGVATVIYTISDGNGGTATASIKITVTAVNDPPVANPSTAATNEDTTLLNIPVLANDTDLDGDTLTVTAASAPNGTVTINADGTVNYSPNLNFNGTDTITYTISDGKGGFSTSTVTVTVGPINDAPVGTVLPPRSSSDADVVSGISVAGNFSDVDGDTLTFSATGLPDGLTISAAGVISGTINTAASQFNGGVYTVTVTASDGKGGTVDQVFTWTVKNPAPVANEDLATTSEDTPVDVIVLTNDVDPDGDTLTVTTASALHGTVSVDAAGKITYTPDDNYNGADTITYTIIDGNGGTSTSTVAITVSPVNDAPTSASTIAPQVNLDADVVSLPTAATFTDLDGDTLSYTATGLPLGLTIDAATGIISGTIDKNASQPAGGVYTIVVSASDGSLSVSNSFTWTITNPAPTANDDTATTAEDTPSAPIAVLLNDADPDGDPLTITSASATNGTVTINANGSLVYSPNANFNGTDTITYVISDGNGGTSTATVLVTITAVNDAPVVASPIADQTSVDAAAISLPTAANFSDLDNATLSYSATGLPLGLSIDAATGIISGTIDKNASQPGGGVYSVTVTASDGSLTAESTFTWTVTNPAPTANSDTAATDEDTLVNIPVLANDTDPDADPLTVSTATAPNGTVTIKPDGTLDYTPNANFNGTDTITYTISDGNGGTFTATVTVTVNPVNDAPVVSAPLGNQTNLDADAVSIPTAAAFSDVDNATLTYSATGLPLGLSIDSVTGIISGTIDKNASQPAGGVYSVTVTASDGSLTTSSAFTWTVTNPAPTATNDVATTDEDTLATIAVLANDVDPDVDPLIVTSASALNGSVQINADGTITYKPNANFNGSDTITYVISDGNGGTSTATVAVTVTAVNDAPTSTALPNLVNVDAANLSGATAIDVSGNFTDVDLDLLAFSATGLPAGLTMSAAGIISGTIDKAASQGGVGGVYTVVVTADDGAGGITSQVFTWTVTNPAPTAQNDVAATNEDTALDIAVLVNDSDPDGDPLTVTAASALHGTVALNADGTITYTPDPNYNGADTITYTISDGNGGTSTATVAVTVAPVNDTPVVASSITNQTSVDSAVISLPTAVNFSDIDNATLSYSATGLPLGLSIDPVTGIISGTIDKNASQPAGGVYSVTVTASDGSLTASSIFTWTVTNPAPTANIDTATTNEDTLINIPVLANDTDPDGDPLTVTMASAPNGTVTIKPDGTLDYTPNLNFNGTDTITYTISDSNGGTSTATVTVTVNPVNDTPVGTAIAPQASVDSAVVSLPVATNFSDVDGTPLNYSATGLPLGLSIDPNTGIISGTIDKGASQPAGGVYSVTVTASDGGLSASQTFSWTVTNPTPTAQNDTSTTAEDTPAVTIAVLTNDTDPDGDTLIVTTASAPNGAVFINPNGTISYTPNLNFNGTDTITYTISDGNGGTSTATVLVTVTPVNDAPSVTGPLAPRFNVDSAAVSVPTAGSFTDLDGDTLSFSATGLPLGLSIDPATGIISGIIDKNASQPLAGVYNVVVTASDGNGGMVSSSFMWIVSNPQPVAVNDIDVITAEDTAVTIPVLANDSDPDGDPLTVTSATAPNGTVVRNADGTITYTPNANFNGTDTITYTISDGNGGTSTATVSIVITSVNDTPTSTPIAARTNLDSQTVSVPVASSFADVDGTPLSYSATGLPAGLAIDPVTGVISGMIDKDASQPGGGVYSVTITATDQSLASTSQTFTWTILNPAPTASNDSALTAEDTSSAPINVLANDSDPDGDTLTVTSATAANGTVTINANGTLVFMPNANFNGTDTITYTISDGNGGTSTATVLVTVTPVNDAPVAQNDNATTPEDAPVTIAVLGNDTDVDGNPLTVIDANSPNGTVVINPDGTITFTPAPNFNGPTTITYAISDSNGGTSTATVTLNVTPVNDAPTVTASLAPQVGVDAATVSVPTAAAFADLDGDTLAFSAMGLPAGLSIDPVTGVISGVIDKNASQPNGGVYSVTVTASDGKGGTVSTTFGWTVTNPPPVAVNDVGITTNEDAPVTITVLANDSDPDGDPLTVTAASSPNGVVVINADGTLIFTPTANFNGPTTISYTISDGNGGTSTATVSITVTPVNDAPVAVNDNATTNEDAPVTLNLIGNDTDVDGDPLTVTAATSPNGTVVINADGTVTFTPAPNFNGPTTITYTISDGKGGTTTATVNVTVAAVNDAPVATNDTATTPEDAPVTINVLGNDTDADGDPLTVTAATSPNGTVVINPDGTITFTPNANFNGPTTITYTISDGRGGTSTATVNVTVTPVNDPPVANNDSAATPEDTPVTINLLGNDTDFDGDPLTVTAATSPNGAVVINADGTITFTPNANFNGPTTITYTISDGRGGTSTATVNVTVTPVNDPPVATNDTATTPEDAPVTINVLGNDADVDGDPLTITAATSPNGTVVINPDGTTTFTPNANFNGATTITYTISDGRGGTSTATVNVTVTPVNDPPVAVNDTAVTPEDTPVRINPLTNDSDIDGNPLTITAARAANGTVVVNADGSTTYTPNPNFNGTDTITYTISDGQGGFSTATITVNVAPVNDPPIARNDVAITDADTPVRISVLGNDNDIDGDPLTITAASSPNGTIVRNADGTITFTPTAGFVGATTITYTISDGKGGTSTATVAVTVRPTNTPPVDGNEAISTIGGVENTIPVLANARDADGNPLSVFSAVADVGTVIINPDGTLKYTAPFGFQGIARITYVVSDGKGGFVTSTVTIDVQQANADMNALIDGSNALAIPDRAVTAPLSPSDMGFISATPYVINAVNEFRSLGGTPDLGGHRPLLTAINGISWLKGTADLDESDGAIDGVVNQIDRIRDLRFGADRLFDHRFGDFILKSLTGFSVRQIHTGNDQIMIESVVRDRVVYMEVRDIGKDGDPRIVEYQLRTRNGGALPEWITMDKRGLAIMERPVDAETLHLIVRAIRADGKVFDIPVLVQGATGEIQLDDALTQKISAVGTLNKNLAMAANSAADETAQLAAAFGEKT